MRLANSQSTINPSQTDSSPHGEREPELCEWGCGEPPHAQRRCRASAPSSTDGEAAAPDRGVTFTEKDARIVTWAAAMYREAYPGGTAEAELRELAGRLHAAAQKNPTENR